MSQANKKSNHRLLRGAMVLLVLFNLIYWPAKLIPGVPDWMLSVYEVMKANWGIFLVLEFMIVASLFADLIIRFDRIQHKKRILHLIIVAALVFAFVFRFILGVMEKYITGVLK